MSTFSIQFKAMGSHMQAWLNADSAADAQILMQVPDWFEEWEDILSRFRPTSELSQLNAHTGKWTTVSSTLFEVIDAAREAAEMTQGMFNPLILNALESLGYDASFDQLAPADSRPMPTLENVPSWRSIQLDRERQSVFLPYGARIDLGGIGKGWAAQQAADRLAAYGACLVDAGGDLVAHGSPDESGGWIVNVPASDEADEMLTLLLVEQAAATSGTDYRHWQRDGHMLHHLIDPRSGRPSVSAIVQATVIAPDAADAVVWAKVSLMTEQFPEYPAVLVYRDGTVQSNLEVQQS